MVLCFLLPFSTCALCSCSVTPSITMPFPSSLFSLSVSVFFFLVLLFSPTQIIPLFVLYANCSLMLCAPLFQVFVRHLLMYVLPLWDLTLQTTEIDSYRFKQENNLLKGCWLPPSIPGKAGKQGVENRQDCREVSYLGLWPESLVVKTALLNAGDCSF